MRKLYLLLTTILLLLTGCNINDYEQNINVFEIDTESTNETNTYQDNNEDIIYIAKDIPVYNGTKIIELNNNVPNFNLEDSNTVFEIYSDLDSLGRCGVAYANICKELMPNEERGTIGHIKPSGWHTVKYNGIVDGNYLYNRCHLIAFCLAGENDNERNLVTGTRSFNVDSMFKYEDMILDYMNNNPNNHVLYRVTPIYVDNELVCRGVQMEAMSVEDNEICFNVFCYNVQDNIVIDYLTGDSWLADTTTIEETTENTTNETEFTYIINTSTHKIHTPDCRYANANNTEEFNGSIFELENNDYIRCKVCNP